MICWMAKSLQQPYMDCFLGLFSLTMDATPQVAQHKISARPSWLSRTNYETCNLTTRFCNCATLTGRNINVNDQNLVIVHWKRKVMHTALRQDTRTIWQKWQKSLSGLGGVIDGGNSDCWLAFVYTFQVILSGLQVISIIVGINFINNLIFVKT